MNKRKKTYTALQIEVCTVEKCQLLAGTIKDTTLPKDSDIGTNTQPTRFTGEILNQDGNDSDIFDDETNFDTGNTLLP